MTSRRRILQLCSLGMFGVLSGCSRALAQPKPVDVLLQNDDTEPWQMEIVVERDSGERVFRTEETIPAGHDVGEVLIKDAFEGASGDRFTVRARLEGDPAGTFDYEITCSTDNRMNLLVEHQPFPAYDGEPVHYVADTCHE